MSEDDFLAEVIPDGKKAVIDANLLQRYGRKKRKTERELEVALDKIESLQSRIWALEAKIEFMELEQPIQIDLVA